MRILSNKYHELYIKDLGIKFLNGETEVLDQKKIETLKSMKGFDFTFIEKETGKIELDQIKEEATALGIEFKKNAGKAKLQELIEAKKAELAQNQDEMLPGNGDENESN